MDKGKEIETEVKVEPDNSVTVVESHKRKATNSRKASFSKKKPESLFSLFFKRRESLLDLYSYIFQNVTASEDDIEILDLSSSAVEGFEDIGFIVEGRLIIISEQTTVAAPNTAARMLMHTSGVYQKIINETDTKLYGGEGLELPVPEFFSFYVGSEDFREGFDELFKKDKSKDSKFKVSVKTYDGKNYRGGWIQSYCMLLDSVENFLSEGFPKDAAVRMAIKLGVDGENKEFSAFLSDNDREVFEMLCARLDKSDYLVARVKASVEGEISNLEEKYTKAGRDLALVAYIRNRREGGCKEEKILNELLTNFNLDKSEAAIVLANA